MKLSPSLTSCQLALLHYRMENMNRKKIKQSQRYLETKKMTENNLSFFLKIYIHCCVPVSIIFLSGSYGGTHFPPECFLKNFNRIIH